MYKRARRDWWLSLVATIALGVIAVVLVVGAIWWGLVQLAMND